MAEGEFFKKLEKEMPKEEEEYIDGFDDLIAAEEKIDSQIQMATDEAMNLTGKLRSSLFGDSRGRTLGDVDSVRKLVHSARLDRTTTGQKIFSVLDDFENVIGWQDRYEEFLERFLDERKFLMHSAFKQIEELHKEIDARDDELGKIKEGIQPLITTNSQGMPQTGRYSMPLAKTEIDETRAKFERRYREYIIHLPDQKRKGYIFGLAQKDPRKRALLEKWFYEEENKRYAEMKAMSIQPPQEDSSQNSPKSAIYSPLDSKSSEKQPLSSEGED